MVIAGTEEENFALGIGSRLRKFHGDPAAGALRPFRAIAGRPVLFSDTFHA